MHAVPSSHTTFPLRKPLSSCSYYLLAGSVRVCSVPMFDSCGLFLSHRRYNQCLLWLLLLLRTACSRNNIAFIIASMPNNTFGDTKHQMSTTMHFIWLEGKFCEWILVFVAFACSEWKKKARDTSQYFSAIAGEFRSTEHTLAWNAQQCSCRCVFAVLAGRSLKTVSSQFHRKRFNRNPNIYMALYGIP